MTAPQGEEIVISRDPEYDAARMVPVQGHKGPTRTRWKGSDYIGVRLNVERAAQLCTKEGPLRQEAIKKKPKNKEKISPINPKSFLERNTSDQVTFETSDSMLSEDLPHQTQERLSTGERDAARALSQPQRRQTTQLLPRFTAIEIAPDGTTVVLGFSAPGAVVRVFLDGRETGSILVGRDGRWASTLARSLAPGDHRLNAIGVDRTGEVAYGRVVEFSVPATNDGAHRIPLDQDEAL